MGMINSILGIVAQPLQNTAAASAAVAAPGAGGAAGAAGTIGGVGATPAATGAGGGFGDVVVKALDGLQAVQGNADSLAVKAATGDLTDVHNYTIAATEASLQTEMTVAVRDRAVAAFNQIMAMQI